MTMETSDAPDKVAAFYKKALSKYGSVLDCANNPNKPEDQNSKALTCETDKPEVGGMIFKAGTKDKQHIVGVEPDGKGTVNNLVYVSVWDSDKRDSSPHQMISGKLDGISLRLLNRFVASDEAGA